MRPAFPLGLTGGRSAQAGPAVGTVAAAHNVDLYCSVKMGSFDAAGNGSMTVT